MGSLPEKYRLLDQRQTACRYNFFQIIFKDLFLSFPIFTRCFLGSPSIAWRTCWNTLTMDVRGTIMFPKGGGWWLETQTNNSICFCCLKQTNKQTFAILSEINRPPDDPLINLSEKNLLGCCFRIHLAEWF